MPEEIKRGMEHCANDKTFCNGECPYYNSFSNGVDCATEMHKNALVYIQQLEREREAMLRDMKAWPACDACKHRNLLCTQKPCSECREAGNGKTVMWEWRGLEEEKHGENA